MNNAYGFIITRHVNSALTNKYWNKCVALLNHLYPSIDIVIIDDNSDGRHVIADAEYKNITIIQSEFHGRGELLPYYYFLKYKFFNNAIIIHDSVFFHKRVHFERLHGVNVMPLWFFQPDQENIENTIRIVRHLQNCTHIENKIKAIVGMTQDKWYGCFGVQTYINISFLETIEHKYKLSNLISAITCRKDRCCLERIMGCIFYSEARSLGKHKSLLGNIRKYQSWGYTYDHYMQHVNRGHLPAPIVKIWTGR